MMLMPSQPAATYSSIVSAIDSGVPTTLKRRLDDLRRSRTFAVCPGGMPSITIFSAPCMPGALSSRSASGVSGLNCAKSMPTAPPIITVNALGSL